MMPPPTPDETLKRWQWQQRQSPRSLKDMPNVTQIIMPPFPVRDGNPSYAVPVHPSLPPWQQPQHQHHHLPHPQSAAAPSQREVTTSTTVLATALTTTPLDEATATVLPRGIPFNLSDYPSLQKYVATHNKIPEHCHKLKGSGTEKQLAAFVANQRSKVKRQHKSCTKYPHRYQALEALGVHWESENDARFDAMFAKLLAFKKEHETTWHTLNVVVGKDNRDSVQINFLKEYYNYSPRPSSHNPVVFVFLVASHLTHTCKN
jgi:hypothetical protein